MKLTPKKEPLTKLNILRKITELDIMKNYCQSFEVSGSRFCSELREDNNPSCVVMVNDGDSTLYCDFATGQRLNAFDYVGEKYGLKFTEVLNVINNDFNLDLESYSDSYVTAPVKRDIKIIKRSSTVYMRAEKRKWEQRDVDYWNGNYGLSKATLERFRVSPVYRYWLRYDRYQPEDITYVYEFKSGRIDIYRPNSEFKFSGNTKSSKDIYGLENASKCKNDGRDVIYIVSSLKEVMLLWEHFDIVAIAPQSETSKIPDKLMREISKHYRKVIVCFDFDTPGINGAIRMYDNIKENVEQPLIQYTCPVLGRVYGKDLSDIYKNGEFDFINMWLS